MRYGTTLLALVWLFSNCGGEIVGTDDNSDEALRGATLNAGFSRCTAPARLGGSWGCLQRTYPDLNNNRYVMRYYYNLKNAPGAVKRSILWFAGERGRWRDASLQQGKATWQNLAYAGLRTVIVDVTGSGYFFRRIRSKPYKTISKAVWWSLNGARYEREINPSGKKLLVAAISNGANMVAAALKHHHASGNISRVVFNAGPLALDYQRECPGAVSNPDVKGLLNAMAPGYGDKCQARQLTSQYIAPITQTRVSCEVLVLTGSRDEFGSWGLNSNQAWRNSLSTSGYFYKHERDFHGPVGHQWQWLRTQQWLRWQYWRLP